MGVSVFHSSDSSEWFTPPDIVERARRSLGGQIDLDPASCAEANKLVRADTFWTKEDNGLAHDWRGYKRIFVNPPGGRGLPALWWDAAAKAAAEGASVVFVMFSIQQLQTIARTKTRDAFAHVCIPRKRVCYWRPDGAFSRPPHASAVVYLGARPTVFYTEFEDVGPILRGHY